MGAKDQGVRIKDNRLLCRQGGKLPPRPTTLALCSPNIGHIANYKRHADAPSQDFLGQ